MPIRFAYEMDINTIWTHGWESVKSRWTPKTLISVNNNKKRLWNKITGSSNTLSYLYQTTTGPKMRTLKRILPFPSAAHKRQNTKLNIVKHARHCLVSCRAQNSQESETRNYFRQYFLQLPKDTWLCTSQQGRTPKQTPNHSQAGWSHTQCNQCYNTRESAGQDGALASC